MSQTYDPLRKFLDISKLKNLEWSPKTGLLKGIRETYQWALEKGVFTEQKNTWQREDLLPLQTQTLQRTAG